MIEGVPLSTFGFFRTIVDTYGAQTIVAPYALMLRGLCFRIDEAWAPSFTTPVNSWTLSFAAVTTNWSLITAPATSWTAI